MDLKSKSYYTTPIEIPIENSNERMKPLLLGLVIYFSQLCHGQLKDCYYMDGRAASTDFPCDPDAEVSTDVAFISDLFDIGLTASRLVHVVA